MKKNNQEEYEVLKGLDDKWKWIARDRDDSLYAFEKKPYKHIRTWLRRGNHDYRIITEAGFQFIQWEDEEPHNIAELIGEYEDTIVTTEFVDGKWRNRIKESEEKEVKKDKKWAQKEVDRYLSYEGVNEARNALTFAKGVINQLDEPEVLSQEENINIVLDDLREHIKEQQSLSQNVGMAHTPAGNDTHYRQYDYVLECIDEYEPSEDLQNLLVPKQELPVIPKFVAEWIEEVKPDNSLRVAFEYIAQQKRDNYDDELAFWVEEGNSETFARAWIDGFTVEEEQKYIISINITDKDSSTNYDTFLNKRGIFHSMENDSFNSEEFNWTEEEIKDLENGEILFEHFAVKVEELEE